MMNHARFYLQSKNIFWVLIVLIVSNRVEAGFFQQGNKLVGTGAVGFAPQGTSVALSSDGSTAIVGADRDSNGIGAVWIWTRSNGTWSQQGNKRVGTGAAGASSQGCSVALSSDGNTALVGGMGDSDGTGAAWVWTRSNGIWSQQGNKLVGRDAKGISAQGFSVSLTPDGNTAIVGGTGDSNGTGAIWIWKRSNGVWSQQGAKLVGVGSDSSSEQGTSVSISLDGNTAMVGGRGDSGRTSAAYVWYRSDSTWSQQGGQLVGTGDGNSANYGAHVSLSADGNTAIVGGAIDDCAWIWVRTGTTWSQQGGKLIGTDENGFAEQGYSVSMSADGNTAVVGGPEDSDVTGAVWVWKRNDGVWLQQGGKLVGTDAVGASNQGYTVFISSDGNTIIVGGTGDNAFAGAAWVFTQNVSPILPMKPNNPELVRINENAVQFVLPQFERVVIHLYGENGRMLSKIFDESRPAGFYAVPLPESRNGSSNLIDYRAGSYHKTLKIQP